MEIRRKQEKQYFQDKYYSYKKRFDKPLHLKYITSVFLSENNYNPTKGGNLFMRKRLKILGIFFVVAIFAAA